MSLDRSPYKSDTTDQYILFYHFWDSCTFCIQSLPKSHINFFISRKWQERWSSCRDNKLFLIKPTLGELPPGCRRSRKEEVVLSRLKFAILIFPTHIFYVGKILLNAQHVRRSTLSNTF